MDVLCAKIIIIIDCSPPLQHSSMQVLWRTIRAATPVYIGISTKKSGSRRAVSTARTCASALTTPNAKQRSHMYENATNPFNHSFYSLHHTFKIASRPKNINAPLNLTLPKDNWAKDIPGKYLNLPDEQKPRKISDLRTEVLILYFQLNTPLHSPSVEQPQIVLSQLHLETHLLPYASPFFIVQKGFPKIAEEVLRVEGRFARAGFRK